jgi:hypothetical protein
VASRLRNVTSRLLRANNLFFGAQKGRALFWVFDYDFLTPIFKGGPAAFRSFLTSKTKPISCLKK